MLVVLLVQGCMSEHAKASGNTTARLNPTQASQDQSVDAQPKPASTLPALPPNVAVTPAALTPAKTNSSTAISQPELVYVIKAGDTLSQIARTHHTTVKTLKLLNKLESDRIIVGNTLKLPSA